MTLLVPLRRRRLRRGDESATFVRSFVRLRGMILRRPVVSRMLVSIWLLRLLVKHRSALSGLRHAGGCYADAYREWVAACLHCAVLRENRTAIEGKEININ